MFLKYNLLTLGSRIAMQKSPASSSYYLLLRMLTWANKDEVDWIKGKRNIATYFLKYLHINNFLYSSQWASQEIQKYVTLHLLNLLRWMDKKYCYLMGWRYDYSKWNILMFQSKNTSKDIDISKLARNLFFK